MSGTSTQPSRVATSDTPPDRPANVITDEYEAARDASPAAPSDQDGQNTDESAASGKDKQKPRRDRSAERKIAKLSKKLADAEASTTASNQRIEALERELEELKAGRGPAPKPARKDFDNDEAYAEAYAEWKAKQAKADAGKKPPAKDGKGKPGDSAKPADGKQPPEQRAGPSEDEITAFKEAGTKKLGDEFLEAYQDSDDVAVNQAMGDYILDSDMGPDLYVWLYHHPEEARKLYFKSEYAVVRRLTKLEEQMSKAGTWDVELEGGKKPAGDGKGGGKGAGSGDDGKESGGRTRRSKAPDPPDQDDRGTPSHETNLEEADMDDYAETRRRQIRKAGAPLL